jgi:pimeloyl-ACP methyl ester carboxylesterase
MLTLMRPQVKALSRLLALALALYLSFVAYLYIFQGHLIFEATPMSEERWKEIAEHYHIDYATIRVDREGHHLQGWFVQGKSGSEPESQPEPLPTVLFFGGNATRAEEVIEHLLKLREMKINVLLVDYRGYGLSEGSPSADALKADAEKIFEAAASHPFVDKEHIIAWGYSLGTGVATHLASVKPVEKLILFAPFTSTLDLARETYPFVPVSLLLKHRFDNVALAPALSQPVLIVQGADDTTFGREHAEKVEAAWKGPKELLLLERRGHDDLLEDEKMWEAVKEFIDDGAVDGN